MQPLTQQGRERLRNIAQRYGVSDDAAQTLLEALLRGSGSMAQFNHPELGGYGQWMRGGMTMVGDMFNNGLKATVDGLCSELSNLLDTHPFEPVPSAGQSFGGGQQQSQGGGYGGGYGGGWWPSELGQPSSSGAQNNMRYAYFAGPRRLVIERDGIVTVYDTLQHQIGGVSQQQGSGYSLSFSSQFGTVDLSQLPIVSSNAPQPVIPSPTLSTFGSTGGQESEQDVFAKIERLADLKQKGVLSEEEFNAKKAELLARI